MDCSGAEFLSIDEGLCVQIMHIGAFDDEPATVAMMDKYLEENGYVNDFTDERRHHEIYLSDPRKVAPEKCKTVIRHPIKGVNCLEMRYNNECKFWIFIYRFNILLMLMLPNIVWSKISRKIMISM